MEILPITAGILSRNSDKTLRNTLQSYKDNGLLDICDEVFILFQNVTSTDIEIATEFDLKFIPLKENVGIGKGFEMLSNVGKCKYFLTLEHDFKLIEDSATTYRRLKEGLDYIEMGVKAVRYRHRNEPGRPLFSQVMYGKELEYVDSEIQKPYSHILDAYHWLEPDIVFGERIKREGLWFRTTSEFACFTNNPVMYNRKWYKETISPFGGTGVQLEGNIGKWWNEQKFDVVAGEGLFKHEDIQKYG